MPPPRTGGAPLPGCPEPPLPQPGQRFEPILASVRVIDGWCAQARRTRLRPRHRHHRAASSRLIQGEVLPDVGLNVGHRLGRVDVRHELLSLEQFDEWLCFFVIFS
jgi:hypothetical protein